MHHEYKYANVQDLYTFIHQYLQLPLELHIFCSSHSKKKNIQRKEIFQNFYTFIEYMRGLT